MEDIRSNGSSVARRIVLLLPRHPLHLRRIDEQFESFAEVAASLAIEVGLLDHDAAERGNLRAALKATWPGARVVYRGWMLTSDQYASLCSFIEEDGAQMFTPADMYRRAHELPGWYKVFADLTPKSTWLADGSLDQLQEIALGFEGSVIIKDWVKSAKHDWDEACFVPDVRDHERLSKVASRFLEIRGENLVGGIVLRAFEDFVGPEIRTWWVDGKLVAVTPHPDTPGLSVPDFDLTSVQAAVERLGCRFVSVDVVQRSDGVLRVIEVGDGQVSDFPDGADATSLISALVNAAQTSI
jgi:hypothetical protein